MADCATLPESRPAIAFLSMGAVGTVAVVIRI